MSRKQGSLRTPDLWPRDPYIANGEPLLPRSAMFAGGQSVGLGNMGWTYFQARYTKTITKLRSFVTNAGVSNTLVREAIYSVDTSDWSLTAILASTANNASTYSTTGKKEVSFSGGNFSEVEGTWYARAILAYGGSANPGFAGMYFGSSDEAAFPPPIFGVRYGPLTDLPSSVAVANLSLIGWGYQGYLLT